MYTSSRPDTTGVRHPVLPGDQPSARPQQAPLPTLRQKVGQPGRTTRVASPQLSRRSKGVRASRGLSKIALQAAAAEAAELTTRTEKEWRLLETEASKSVTLASELIPAISKAEEKARFARITADIAARLAGEADAKAREEQPKAVQALEGLRKQVQEWQGLGSGTSAKGLHSLASSRLAAWCTMHVDDATSYQEVDSQEIGIGELEGPALLAAEVAAAEVDGKQYAVVAIAIGEEGTSKGQLAGTHLHWGCCQKEGSGWKAPPPGWHTDPNVSHPKGSAWETPFALYAPKKDGQVDAASGAYVLGLQLPLQDVLRGGGIEFILKRDRQPEWVSNVHRRNFFVSLAKAAEFFDKPQEPESSAPETVTLPEDSPEWVVLDAAEGRTASGQARSPGNLRQQLQAMAQLLESPPPAAEGNGKVAALTSELEQVATHVSAAEQAAESAREGQEIASSSAREVQQAEQELRETQAKAESAILAARQKTALLKGKNEEVSLEDLLRITKDRLAQSAAAGPSASAEDASKGLEPVEFAARMDGLLGHVAGHAQLTRDESGKPAAVVTLAAAESFPDGLLQDAKLHWGVCLHEESGWARAPQGWQASPQGSHEAGGVATETPLERVDLPDGSSNANAAAYAATVQLPLESGLVGALSFVVHAPGGRWVACNRANSRQDFFFSLSPLMKAVRKEQKEKAAKKGPKSVEAATEASTEASSKPAASAAGDESAGQPAASDQDLSSEGGLGSSK